MDLLQNRHWGRFRSGGGERGRGEVTATGNQAATAVQAFPQPRAAVEAHRALLRDTSIQFDLPPHIVKQNPPPEWLKSLLRGMQSFVEWVGPAWQWILIAIGVALAIALLFAISPAARRWVAERLARRPQGQDEAAWRPDQASARTLLEDADRLAAEGRYDEAVHLVLFRSIEDIDRWRGNPLAPSLTSRDIAALPALPDRARSIFGNIVAAVEASLFARRPLGKSDWEQVRTDYAGFALGPA